MSAAADISGVHRRVPCARCESHVEQIGALRSEEARLRGALANRESDARTLEGWAIENANAADLARDERDAHGARVQRFIRSMPRYALAFAALGVGLHTMLCALGVGAVASAFVAVSALGIAVSIGSRGAT